MIKNEVTVQIQPPNATHFVGVAYPPNKISKTVLKMQAFYTCFLKFCLALNSYKKTKSGLFKQPLFCYTIIVMNIGVWRSLVARSAGGREVAGSNPVAPIFDEQELE